MSIAGLLIPGLIAGGVSGGLGLVGANNADSGPSEPNLLDPKSIVNFLLALANSASTRQAYEQYSRMADRVIQDSVRIAQERTPETMRLYDASAQEALRTIQRGNQEMLRRGEALPGTINQSRLSFLRDLEQQTQERQQGYGAGMQAFLGGMRGDEESILGGYRDRYRFAEEELQGYGEQQKSDIERMFENKSGQIASDLVSRGLASSTESAKQQLLNTELESSEQRRLGEDLARSRINVLGGIRGEQSMAQERLAGQRNQYAFGGMQAGYAQQSESDRVQAAYDAAMRGDVLGAQRAMIGYGQQAAGNEANFYNANAANRSGIYERGTGGLLDVLGGINYIPPPGNALNYQFGQNAGAIPQSASPWPNMFANAAPGFGNFGGAAAMSYFNRPPMQPAPFPAGGFQNPPYGYQGPNTGYTNEQMWFPQQLPPGYNDAMWT